MIDLGSWMNKILIGWGVDPKIANTFDETIIAILMIFYCGRTGLSLPGHFCGWNKASGTADSL